MTNHPDVDARTDTGRARLRIAVVWPKPRQGRWDAGLRTPSESPDFSDGLLFLRDEGFDVTLEDSLSVPLNPLVNVHEFYSGLDPLRAVRIAWRARRYDAVVAVGDSTALFLLWLRRIFGLRLAIILVDPALAPGYDRRKRLQDHVLPGVEEVVVFGMVQLDYLASEYGGRVSSTFLHHRADVDFYRPESTLPPAQPPYIFSIGNDASRDFETLRQAAVMCREEPGVAHDFRVHTVLPVEGGGVLDLHRETISFVQMRALYERASLVVVPLFDSRHAGGINSLLEAMAMAKPIVVSGSHGIKQYIEHGSTAFVVPPRDPAAMSAAIRRLLQFPAEARALGENARRFVVEHCNNRLYARLMANIVRRAVKKRAARLSG